MEKIQLEFKLHFILNKCKIKLNKIKFKKTGHLKV